MSEEQRCLVIDWHPVARLGVGRALADRYEVDEAAEGREALELLTSVGDFDVAVVEVGRRFAGSPRSLVGIDAVRALRKAHPALGIVARGHPDRHAAKAAIDAGATAYVAKNSPADSLVRAVDAAAAAEPFIDPAAGSARNGGPRITRRQREILQGYADGHSTAQVAKRLGLSLETIRTHTKALLARLEARDRAHAVAIGLRSSLID